MGGTVTTPANTAYCSSSLYMTVPAGGTTIDVTLRIGLPQNEIGSFVSPPIKTGSGTRASDNPNLTNQALAVAQKAKSAFFMSNGVTYSNSNRWLQYPTTNGTALQIFMTSQTGMQVNNSIVAASAINQNWSNLSKISASYDSNVICAKAKDGAKVVTRDGERARIICYDKVDDTDLEYPIVALIMAGTEKGECMMDYTLKGKWNGCQEESCKDLMIEETEFEDGDIIAFGNLGFPPIMAIFKGYWKKDINDPGLIYHVCLHMGTVDYYNGVLCNSDNLRLATEEEKQYQNALKLANMIEDNDSKNAMKSALMTAKSEQDKAQIKIKYIDSQRQALERDQEQALERVQKGSEEELIILEEYRQKRIDLDNEEVS